jgi:hypothetical protein
MPPMPARSIFVRVALLAVLLAGLVTLADGIARYELQQAIGGTAVADASVDAQPASIPDED